MGKQAHTNDFNQHTQRKVKKKTCEFFLLFDDNRDLAKDGKSEITRMLWKCEKLLAYRYRNILDLHALLILDAVEILMLRDKIKKVMEGKLSGNLKWVEEFKFAFS